MGQFGQRGRRFQAESLALFAAMTTQPTYARKIQIDNVIFRQKGWDIWSKWDTFYILAAADSQAACLNWENPAAFTALPVLAPTFTVDRGFQGNGTSSFLNTQYDLTVNPVRVLLNSNSLFVWSRTPGQLGTVASECGQSRFGIGIRSTTNFLNTRSTTTSNDATANVIDTGLFGFSRNDSAGYDQYVRGLSVGNKVRTSSAFTPNNLTICARDGGVGGATFSTRQFACFGVGAGMTAAQWAAFNWIMTDYMNAVGAA